MSVDRRSIYVPGLSHGTVPIPTASRVGPFVATGGIRGVDRVTGDLPDEVSEQIRLMFDNLAVTLDAAGAGLDGVLKVTVWARSLDCREALNEHWVRLFPDASARPVRHLMSYDLPGRMLIQCEALAVVSETPL